MSRAVRFYFHWARGMKRLALREKKQFTQGCYMEADRPRFEPATFRIASERSTVKPHRQPTYAYTLEQSPHQYKRWLDVE